MDGRCVVEESKGPGDATQRWDDRYRALVENANDGICVVDNADLGTIVLLNPAFAAMLGYTVEEMEGMSVFDLHLREDLPRARDVLRRGFQGKPALETFWLRRRDGEQIFVEIKPVLMNLEGKNFVVFTNRDVTEHKRMDERLFQSQKMETIGRLASGVAHDFNNLLTAIMSYTQIGMMEVPPTSRLATYLEQINKAAQRASSLTGQLLALSRNQIIAPRVIDLNRLLLDMDSLLRRLIGEDIEMATLPSPGRAPVMADVGQVEQVVINLALNAYDAMPKGGKLTIETANVTLDNDSTRPDVGLVPGAYVLLSLSDTGVGMTEEVMSKALEPFFTTKSPGEGTGLGLSTSYGIVKQSGGHIEIESAPGKGTTVRIYLPRVEGQTETLTVSSEAGDLPTGTETVLLEEDDVSIREMAGLVLRERGYTVLKAANGEEALQVAEQGPDRGIDLLLADVVMPKLSASALAQRLAAAHPDITVLYMSGLSREALFMHGVLGPGTLVLQKPFTPGMLIRRVREALDS